MTIYRYICGCGYFSEASPAESDFDFERERRRRDAYEQDAIDHHVYCCEAKQRGESGPCHEAGGRDNPDCPVYGVEVSA